MDYNSPKSGLPLPNTQADHNSSNLQVGSTSSRAYNYDYDKGDPQSGFNPAPLGPFTFRRRDLPEEIESIVKEKHLEYARKAKFNRFVYYCLTSVASLGAILTPVAIPLSSIVAQVASVAVVVCLALDQILRPKERWQGYDLATSMLSIEMLKAQGLYETNKEIVDLLVKTEIAALKTVPSINEVISRIQSVDRDQEHRASSVGL